MLIEWGPFPIDLPDFASWLAFNYPETDGINATPEYLEIIESELLTSIAVAEIIAYLESLDEQTEALKRSRPSRVQAAIHKLKLSIDLDSGHALNDLERKIVQNQTLSYAEEETILNQYP